MADKNNNNNDETLKNQRETLDNQEKEIDNNNESDIVYSEKEMQKESKKTKDEKKESSKPEKKKKKDKKDEQIEELNDKLLRNRAEFDNFRKRTEKEKLQMYEIGAKDVVEKILPVIDNFERGLAAIPDDESLISFKEGIDMIYKQFINTLSDIGVKPIETVGKEFDPEYHNAVMHIEDENFGENTITEEFQKGYLYHDKVIRHSMVKVAN